MTVPMNQYRKEEEDKKLKKLRVLNTIAEDMKRDAERFDGSPFNGKTVGKYFGYQGAAIAALANILHSLIKES